MPTHRVIANLGELSDLEIENVRQALKASRASKSVIIPEAPALNCEMLASLAFLDVAVALEMWRSWKLSELFAQLIPENDPAMTSSDVLCALAIQRCIAPGSKLQAQRWFPETALPELLGVVPSHFHNTRIHRVLDKLDSVDEQLQEALVRRYEQRDGAFVSLFTDVTDAWFEGRGPDLAERARTKEGMTNLFKIGILLLCNEHGYPMRWRTLPGRTQDGEALRDLVGSIEGLDWAQNIPIVFDRAMGTASAVARLIQSKLRFLTAVPRTEIDSYCKHPDDMASRFNALHDLVGSEDREQCKAVAAEAALRVSQCGMEKVDDRLYVLDLGTTDRVFRVPQDVAELDVDVETLEGGALSLHRARTFQAGLADKTYRTQADIAKQIGVTPARMSQLMGLLRLDEALQNKVLAGECGNIGEALLRDIARRRTKAEQRRAFAELIKPKDANDSNQRPQKRQRSGTAVEKAAGKADACVRRILYFNPMLFVEMRATAERHRTEIDTYISDLNARLRCRSNKATRESVYADISAKLSSRSMLSVYAISVDSCIDKGHEHLVVSLRFDEEKWNERRKHDGFVLLVAHPELPNSAQQLAALYRAKDKIEKDFQTIKSDIQIRPVFHHTNPKVRAHVSVCMLALLLEREMERRCREAGSPQTAPDALEQMASGRLCMVGMGKDTPITYMPTTVRAEQSAMLARLGLERLGDREQLASIIHPMPAR